MNLAEILKYITIIICFIGIIIVDSSIYYLLLVIIIIVTNNSIDIARIYERLEK